MEQAWENRAGHAAAQWAELTTWNARVSRLWLERFGPAANDNEPPEAALAGARPFAA